MKYAIPLGAVLLIGIASSLSRSPISPAGPGRSASIRTAPTPAANCLSEPAMPVGLESGTVDVPVQKAPAVAAVRPAPAAWTKMLGTLDRAVGLTSIQQSTFEQVLRERENEIQAYLKSIRVSGVLDVREYEWRSDQMKGSWYRRMDALLDRGQHERFLVLLEKGFLNEGLELTIDPGMTVLE